MLKSWEEFSIKNDPRISLFSLKVTHGAHVHFAHLLMQGKDDREKLAALKALDAHVVEESAKVSSDNIVIGNIQISNYNIISSLSMCAYVALVRNLLFYPQEKKKDFFRKQATLDKW